MLAIHNCNIHAKLEKCHGLQARKNCPWQEGYTRIANILPVLAASLSANKKAHRKDIPVGF
jgi:hypothetical protein